MLSPGMFNNILRDQLSKCKLPENTIVIQYVDDLLLAGTSAEKCMEAT